MNILVTAAEVAPLAKVGGLADVAGSLPKALSKLEHDVRVVMPKYKTIDKTKFPAKTLIKKISIPMGKKQISCSIEKTAIPDAKIPVYLIANDKYYNRDGIYQDSKGIDFPDNGERFIYLSKAVLEMLKALDWRPDVIHCNDWHTALIPVYLKSLPACACLPVRARTQTGPHADRYKSEPKLEKIATLYTVHNLAFQGLMPKNKASLTGLKDDSEVMKALMFGDQINLMKGGLTCADIINTVSERYSREIQTREYGCGLESVLQARRKELHGVLNGIDYDLWNPATDKDIAQNYDYKTIDGLPVRCTQTGKKVCKKALQKAMKLPQSENTPIIGMISRLDPGKGFDILAESIHDIMNLDVQFILLGTGIPQYHEMFEEIGAQYPQKMFVNLKFDAKLARQIYAGADIFLMPSRYEPCGLGQMISLAYGTIPVVRSVGGLADTILNFDPESKKGNGFVFEKYSAEQLFAQAKRAVETFADKKAWGKLIKNAMDSDFSWDVSAKKYVELYEKAIAKRA